MCIRDSRSALTYKAQDNEILVLDQLSFDAPKTKTFVSMAKALNVDGQKTLYVVSVSYTHLFILSAKSRQSCEQDCETVDFCNSLMC